MSETQVEDSTAAAAAKKPATERTAVKMEDGSTVEFAGARQVNKSYSTDEASGVVTARFDFRNGAVRKVSSDQLTKELLLRLVGHGLVQKVGDEWSGVKELDDIVLTADEIIGRLLKGEWGTVREGGDSMAGAGIVIKAVCEVTGKTSEEIKAFLQGKLDAAKAKGEKLSRQDLYKAFRAPGSKTAAVIRRLEEAKLAASSKISSDELLGEIG